MGDLDTTDVTAGASDDIRRATELAYRSVSEFGLSAAVGPLAVASMAGDDGSFTLRDSGSMLTFIVLSVLCVFTTAYPSTGSMLTPVCLGCLWPTVFILLACL